MFRIIAIMLLLAGLILAFWFLYYGGYLTGEFLNPDKEKAKEVQPFFTGLVVPLLTLGSTLLVFENLRNTSRQNFGNNFFKLIDQHHKLVDNICTWVEPISTEQNPCKGRNFFDELASRIANDYFVLSDPAHKDQYEVYDVEEDLQKAAIGKNGKDLLLVIYDYYFHIHQSELSHYFRNLYRIVRYAETSPFSKSFKRQHVKMLRAQLSNYEILILAYNGMYGYGKKFYRLIEKFELIRNLNTEERVPSNWEKRIVDPQILEEGYSHFRKLRTEKKDA